MAADQGRAQAPPPPLLEAIREQILLEAPCIQAVENRQGLAHASVPGPVEVDAPESARALNAIREPILGEAPHIPPAENL